MQPWLGSAADCRVSVVSFFLDLEDEDDLAAFAFFSASALAGLLLRFRFGSFFRRSLIGRRCRCLDSRVCRGVCVRCGVRVRCGPGICCTCVCCPVRARIGCGLVRSG